MDIEYLKNNFPVSIYAIYHKPYIIVDSEVITPISPKEYGLNMLTADTLDNIADKNNEFSEYTTLYWVWKNNHTAKYVGFFHYRRYLCFERIVNANDNFLKNIKWDYETLYKLLNDYDFILPPRLFWGEM